ncbi:YhcN/YlaJ family sporulation lipoprotein [Virgibacillus sp. W0181]|uniref:YhcN/YlaJ family sporulation lipoprotein n=1 Tax=Virgibacillus sp. W0181 TaxID=3391581 RepID=UPI003F47D9D6
MVKKMSLTFLLIGGLSLFMIGCSENNDATEDGNKLDQLDPTLEKSTNTDNQINKLGYVRYTQDEIKEDNERNRAVTMDRDKMADIIARIILRNDDFAEVATLVTDEQVLIAYQTNDDQVTEYTSDIARKSAMSIVPAYYEIYVSDNDVLMNDIHSLKNSTTENKNYENTVNAIIKEMKKTPQGQERKTD